MRHDGPQAVYKISKEGFARCRRLFVACWGAEQGNGAEKTPITIGRKGGRSAAMQDHPTGERGPPCQDPQLCVSGGHGDCRGKSIPFDKMRQQTKLCRNAEGVDGAMKESKDSKNADCQVSRKGKALLG
jgi:hypothetical protein